MTPQQFLNHLKSDEPAPAYLFLGPEPFQREFCRKTLIKRMLPDEEARENGLARHDLEDETLAAVIEDACSPSLFTSTRVLWVSHAEDALPKVKPGVKEKEEEQGDAALLAHYMANPTPGVVVVFEAPEYGFQGEDKKKIERVRKFYSAVEAHVEFPHMNASQALQLAQNLAKRAGLRIGSSELSLLVEALGADGARIATEIEKLQLFAGTEKEVTAQMIGELTPGARDTTIFALVDALARHDRARSLEQLDALVRQGEYLPLALSFLSNQLRLAYSAKEANLRSAAQIQAHFARSGVPMWPSRAEQIAQTVAAFSKDQFEKVLKRLFAADKALRDARPDDRLVMEEFIVGVTGK